jgi:hypothetical protein
MITEKFIAEEWHLDPDDATSQLLKLTESFSENEFNANGSSTAWNAAKVCEHIIRSAEAIADALSARAKAADRNAEERVLELKELFLNFDKKFQSPRFVLPVETGYTRGAFAEDLKKSMERVRELSKSVNLFETIDVPGFGELTKPELFHFIIFHT